MNTQVQETIQISQSTLVDFLNRNEVDFETNPFGEVSSYKSKTGWVTIKSHDLESDSNWKLLKRNIKNNI